MILPPALDPNPDPGLLTPSPERIKIRIKIRSRRGR
jgi:hypothetical protein